MTVSVRLRIYFAVVKIPNKLADLSVNIKTYQHGISGAIARDTPVPSDCTKKCQQCMCVHLSGSGHDTRDTAVVTARGAAATHSWRISGKAQPFAQA
jgi:hypothetical protein